MSFNLAKGHKPKCLGLKGLESFPAGKVAGPFFVAAVFACGNCDNLIVFRYGRPIRCSKCGEDIDWSVVTRRKKILFCPQCGRADFQFDVDKYCDSCPTILQNNGDCRMKVYFKLDCIVSFRVLERVWNDDG